MRRVVAWIVEGLVQASLQDDPTGLDLDGRLDLDDGPWRPAGRMCPTNIVGADDDVFERLR